MVSAAEIQSAPEFGEGGRQDIRRNYGYLDPALQLDLTHRAGWMLSTMIGSSVLFRHPAIPGLLLLLRTRVSQSGRVVLAGALAGGASIGLFVSSADSDLRFVRDRHPVVTAYLRSQPPDVLVAGAGGDTASVPSLAGRRILASYEHALPFHPSYYRELRPRIEDLIGAYYAPSLRGVIDFADHYEVDIFLVNRLAFTERGFNQAWTGDPRYRWHPFTPMIARKVQQSGRPALIAALRPCAAVDDGEIAVVPTSCLRGLQTGPLLVR
jgi:hypothetical protein